MLNWTEGLHASLGPMKRKHVVPPPTSIIIVLVKEFEFIEFSAVIHPPSHPIDYFVVLVR